MRFIELFAGIGGFRYGLEAVQNTGYQTTHRQETTERISGMVSDTKCDTIQRTLFSCVWANEIDKYACQIYRKNYGEGELYEGDITTVNTNDIPDHDILVGGFPCQAFSIAGKRAGFGDTRGTLFFEIARILDHHRPKCVLLENVKGLLSHDSGKTFQTILKVLADIGYRVEWQVLNSKDFGVPQNRERVFIIGHLGKRSRGQIFPIGNQNEKSCVEVGSIKAISGHDILKRCYSTDGLSPVLNTCGGGNTEGKFLVEDLKIRRLTPTECERLQGFPDGWTEGISDSQRYKCLGNAVTTNVIQAIGEKLCQA